MRTFGWAFGELAMALQDRQVLLRHELSQARIDAAAEGERITAKLSELEGALNAINWSQALVAALAMDVLDGEEISEDR